MSKQSNPGGNTVTHACPGQTVDDFKRKFAGATDGDIEELIKMALGKLAENDTWLTSYEFSKLAKVSTKQLSSMREQFADHVVHIRRSNQWAWFGMAKTAQQMRELLGV